MKVSGLYSALEYTVIRINNAEQITIVDDALNQLVSSNQQDAIVSIVLFPFAYINTGNESPYVVDEVPKRHDQAITAPTSIGNYTPRNKKLLTYPYMFLTVDTLNDCKDYRYEYFDNRNNIEFAEYGCVSANPEVVVMPMNYNGSGGTAQFPVNPTESVTCAGFPQCAYVIDSYRAWIAQKSTDYSLSQTQMIFKEIGSVINLANPSAVLGAGQYPLQMERETNAAMIEQTAGSKVRGTSGASAEVATLAKGIYYKHMSITEQFARRIDDFFDRFGYSSGRIKIPNRNVRPHWTYTKTVDVAIRGNVPVDDMRKIKAIYNNGITFWRNGSEVGNYSLNNSV